MDARQWHAGCMAPEPARPPVVDERAMGEMTTPQRREYGQNVHAYFRRAPASSPVHEQVAGDLEESWRFLQHEPPGARTILALTAPFSAGKSTVAKGFAARIHRSVVGPAATAHDMPSHVVDGDVDADLVPVVYLNLQSDTASKDLYAQVLAFLGHGNTATRGVLASRATAALAIHGVRLVVVDDAHMLRTHLKQGRATLDALKHLGTEIGELGGGLALIGAFTPDSDLLNDPQIRGRLRVHSFGPYGHNGDEQRRAWQRLLKNWEIALEPYLPELKPGDLARRWAGLTFLRTQGYAGDVASCLSHATELALSSGRLTLNEHDIEHARVSQRALDDEAVQRAAPSNGGARREGRRHAG